VNPEAPSLAGRDETTAAPPATPPLTRFDVGPPGCDAVVPLDELSTLEEYALTSALRDLRVLRHQLWWYLRPWLDEIDARGNHAGLYAELAERLGTTRQNTRIRLRRAIEWCTERLEADGFDRGPNAAAVVGRCARLRDVLKDAVDRDEREPLDEVEARTIARMRSLLPAELRDEKPPVRDDTGRELPVWVQWLGAAALVALAGLVAWTWLP